MGVGDYVHSRDVPQPSQSRQFLAEQAKVDIPATKFAAPAPRVANGNYNGSHFPDQQQAPYENPAQGDMFDTDVEGVDESTAAGTTIYDPDETQQFNIPPSRQYNNENRSLRQSRQAPRQYETNWYENLGDRAMKTAGFDSDAADVDNDDESQMGSSLAEDDDGVSEANGWHYAQNQRAAEEPLSRRLENFWNASNKAYPKSSIPQPSHPAMAPSAPDARRGQTAPNGGRKVTLPRSRTGTPTTRFNPPRTQPVEQRGPSPTRRASTPHAQPTRKAGTPVAFPVDEVDDGSVFTAESERHTSGHPGTIFDITNLDIIDDDATIRDPFSKPASSTLPQTEQSIPKKRPLEPDYPPEILYQKPFSDLQSEPFDYAPTPTPPATTQPDKPLPETEDKITLLLRLPEHDRNSYLSILSIDAWEDCGDQLLDRFSQILSRMKDLRHARRKTAAVFEAEVARRHALVEEQSVELSGKLNNMRTGGAEVLRGRSPFCG